MLICGFYHNPKIKAHFKKHKVKYILGGTVLATQLMLPDFAFANSLDPAGQKLYGKIVNVGKWVIIVKGGISIIQNLLEGDSSSAKQSFLTYMMVYVTLLALPKGLDLIDDAFADL